MEIRRPSSSRLAAVIAFVLVGLLVLAAVPVAGSVPARTGAAEVSAARPDAVSSALAVVDPVLAAARGAVRVIVQQQTGGAGERAVARLGGRVTRALPVVDGFAATLPAGAVPELARTPGVRAVARDRRMHVQARLAAPPPSTPRSVYPRVVRADAVWRAGVTGSGSTVAIVDTGVADVPDLHGRIVQVTDDLTGQVAACVNLSGEASCADSYGHGTFIAGIIAGNGASSGGKWKGAAPGARVLSLKIAGRDGAADVSNVLAAIQWVVSFKDRYGIGVLNLSLGTDATQSYAVDPLNYAVERAWAAGIAVVVSASNLGPDPGTISKPGDDPFVITVGAIDDNGTVSLGDDLLPAFSSRGPTAADGLAKPDVVAPGGHVISLRAPGSAIDTQFPVYVDGAYRKGSGTSMAAGVASGIAALLLQADPGMTPDRLKHALTATTQATVSTDPMAVGSGLADAHAAAFAAPPGTANQGLERSSGLGVLHLSRGSVRVKTDDLLGGSLGLVLGGLLTAQLLFWDPLGYTAGSWSAGTWYSTGWYTSRWYRLTWAGNDWGGNNWRNDHYWYGNSWYGSAWYGAWE